MEKIRAAWLHASRIGIIAILYAGVTIACIPLEGSLAWGPIQFRFSEVLCVLALFTADAIPGLAIGCAIANLANLALSGLGSFSALGLAYSVAMAIAGSLFAWRFRKHPYIAVAGLLAINAIIVFLIHAHFGTLGVLDAVFGFIASAFAAAFIWKYRDRPAFALLGPVITNALIVPAYLPLMVEGASFYVIPFTDISVQGLYLLMYLYGFLSIGIGEAVVIYVLGLPLARALKGTRLASLLESGNPPTLS